MKTYITKSTKNTQPKEKGKGASLAPPPLQRKANKTGMPDQLKSGIENLSGIDMSDVKVHYNSSQPAQLNAHAYAQGNQIHVATGQEKHLPHEAWHVVQQKQGRVKPTMQLKGKVNINDEVGLEKEADVMGVKALLPIQLKDGDDESDLELFADHFRGRGGMAAVAQDKEARAREEASARREDKKEQRVADLDEMELLAAQVIDAKEGEQQQKALARFRDFIIEKRFYWMPKNIMDLVLPMQSDTSTLTRQENKKLLEHVIMMRNLAEQSK
jgi:hypothetical protein